MSGYFDNLSDDEDFDLAPGGDSDATTQQQQRPVAKQPAQAPAAPRQQTTTSAALLRGRVAGTKQSPPAAAAPQTAVPAPQPQRNRPVPPAPVAPPAPVQRPQVPAPSLPAQAPAPAVPQQTVPVAQPSQVPPPLPEPEIEDFAPVAAEPVAAPPSASPYRANRQEAAALVPSVVDDYEPQVHRASPFERPTPQRAEPSPAVATAAAPAEAKPGLIKWLFGPFLGQPTSKQGKAAQERRGSTPSRDDSISTRKNPRAQSDNYAGARRRQRLIAIVFWSVMGIVVLAGLARLFLPSPQPTKADIEYVARQATEYTGFPQELGKTVATGFTEAFLTYSTTDPLNTRVDAISKYVDPTLLKNFNLSQQGATSGDAVEVNQTITSGPFIVGERDLDENSSVITTASQLNDGKWVYLSIPVLAHADRGTAAVSGTPSFVPPVHRAAVNENLYNAPWSGSDKDAVANLSPRLALYLAAWAQSDNQAAIQSYLTTDATDAAKDGLYGVVSYLGTTGLTVQPLAKDGSNQTARYAQFDVRWVDSKSGLVYTQTYRLVINYANGNWSISDIQNVALLANDNNE